MEDLESAVSPHWTAAPVLPGQVDAGSRFDASVSAELALRLAVLEDAIRCLALGHRPRHPGEKRLAREAEAWIRNLDRRWPFSFANVCDALGIEVVSLRRKLIELRHPATLTGARPQVVMPPSIDRMAPAM
jgi:hypothetical protein